MTAAPGTGRRGGAARRALLLVLLLPVVEVLLVVLVGHLVGAWPTVLLLVAGSVLGAWLVRREGARTWRTLTTALRTGGRPAQELSDAALVLAGGVLILVPGFLTDLVGLLLVLPVTRPLARRLLVAFAARRLVGAVTVVGGQVVGGQVVDHGPRDSDHRGTDHRGSDHRGPGEPPGVVEGRVL